MPDYYLDPNGDGKLQGTTFPTAGQTGWSNLNKAVRSPTAPSTASGVKDNTAGHSNVFDVTTFTLAVNEVVTNTAVFAYFDTPAGGGFTLKLHDGPGNTDLATTTIGASVATGWSFAAVAGTLTQAQINGIQASAGTTNTTTPFNNYYEFYIQVTTKYLSHVPDLDRRLRRNSLLRR